MILASLVIVFLMNSTHLDNVRLQVERDVISAVQRGETHQFQFIVDQYKHRIIAMIGRQVGDHATAEDLAQEVFVRAYRGISSFRGDSLLSTWLIKISLNVTHSYFSSKAYRQRSHSESFDSQRHDAPRDEYQLEDGEMEGQKAAFREALSELKPHLREALSLCALEGRSYQEAADMMGIPIGTVRSRLNKARLILQEKLVGKQKDKR